MARKNMTICRFTKLKSMAEISGSAAHMIRSDHAANADPERAGLNRVIVGGSDPAAEVRDRLEGIWSRTNSVLAIEVMLSASPEWWIGAQPDQVDAWIKASVRFLDEVFGKPNVVHLRMHFDETTPHLTGYVVPIVDGRLNARAFLGGKEKMRVLQDKAAAAVAHLDIARGLKGSQASHVSLKKFYATLSGEVPTPDPEIIPMLVALAKNSNDNAHAAKQATARLRALDLDQVLVAAGLDRSQRDAKRWVDVEDRFAITVNGNKWYDHKSGSGKGGAIDLVQHLLGCDFATSRAWLVSRFDRELLVADECAKAERKAHIEISKAVPLEFIPPEPSEENWAKVRKYLVEHRGLAGNFIDRQHDAGDIYADVRSNAIFLSRDETGTPVGAEVRGVDPMRPYKGAALGSRRERGLFSIGNAAANVVVVVESAIDAISYAMLKALAGFRDILKTTRIVSTGGVRREPPPGLERKHVICAYDADPAGDKAAIWGTRVRPIKHKDWNAELQDILSFRLNPAKAQAAAERENARLRELEETAVSSFQAAITDLALGEDGVDEMEKLEDGRGGDRVGLDESLPF